MMSTPHKPTSGRQALLLALDTASTDDSYKIQRAEARKKAARIARKNKSISMPSVRNAFVLAELERLPREAARQVAEFRIQLSRTRKAARLKEFRDRARLAARVLGWYLLVMTLLLLGAAALYFGLDLSGVSGPLGYPDGVGP